MENYIHPTVYINPKTNFVIGKGNYIGPNVVIEGDTEIGDNNKIGPGNFFFNKIKIGSNNIFVGGSSFGSLGEMGTKGDSYNSNNLVIVGNFNTFREYITVNFPVRKKYTLIGDRCYFMARTHIPHDAEVKNYVVMATNSLIGGGCMVDDYAYIGLGSITHQWCNIGESAMIGLQAGNTKHIPPFIIVTGVPSRILKLNIEGAKRRGFSEMVIDEASVNLKKILANEYLSENYIVAKINEFILSNPDYLNKYI